MAKKAEKNIFVQMSTYYVLDWVFGKPNPSLAHYKDALISLHQPFILYFHFYLTRNESTKQQDASEQEQNSWLKSYPNADNCMQRKYYQLQAMGKTDGFERIVNTFRHHLKNILTVPSIMMVGIELQVHTYLVSSTSTYVKNSKKL